MVDFIQKAIKKPGAFTKQAKRAKMTVKGFETKVLKNPKNYSSFEKNGLIPNMLPVNYNMAPAYNSADASLWYLWAVQEFVNYTFLEH